MNSTVQQKAQAEAIRFLLALTSNYALDIAWQSASDNTAKQLLLTKWKFQTTPVDVNTMLNNSTVKTALAGYTATPIATHFVNELNTNTDLAENWNNTLQLAVDNYNKDGQLDTFLRQNGFNCTYQQVAAAACDEQKSQLNWWHGSYVTYIVGNQPLSNDVDLSSFPRGPLVQIKDDNQLSIENSIETVSFAQGLITSATDKVKLLMTLATPVSGSSSGSQMGFAGSIIYQGKTLNLVGKVNHPQAQENSVGLEAISDLEAVGKFLLNQFLGWVETEILKAVVNALWSGLTSLYDSLVNSATKSVTDAMRPSLQALNKLKAAQNSKPQDESEKSDSDDQDNSNNNSDNNSDSGSDTDAGNGDSGTDVGTDATADASTDTAGDAVAGAVGDTVADAGAAAGGDALLDALPLLFLL